LTNTTHIVQKLAKIRVNSVIADANFPQFTVTPNIQKRN